MIKNIFILGLDELGRQELATLPGAEQYVFHGLLTIEELQSGVVSFLDLLQQAQRQLDAFHGPIDAVVGYWDFPVSMLVPILCSRYGLRSKDLEAVVRCEHKYWSRLEQQKVISEWPAFALIDLENRSGDLPENLSYPVWIKPIKSFSSEGAHHADNRAELLDVLEEERQKPSRLGAAFATVLDMLDLPEEIASIHGDAFMVEETAHGQQCTVEGYSWGEEIVIIGVVDSIRYDNVSSFLRYQYPSGLPASVKEHMRDVSRRVISAMGLRNTTFNIEYFWDEATERLTLLEINTRHSQSHAPLFRLVDGLPHHTVMIDLALGREPYMPHGEGQFPMAAKWFVRRFSDGLVHKVPTAQDVADITQKYPGTIIEVTCAEGTQLSKTDREDSYSFTLAEIFTPGDDEEELRHVYDQCRAALEFEIADVPAGT